MCQASRGIEGARRHDADPIRRIDPAAQPGAPKHAHGIAAASRLTFKLPFRRFLDRPFDNLMRPMTGVASHAMDACARTALTPPMRRPLPTFAERVR
jgi:hypothetical protein